MNRTVAHFVQRRTKQTITLAKTAKVYVLHPGAATKSRREPSNDSIPVTIQLSAAAREKLAELQLKSLDREGRQPTPSQVIEELINAAAAGEPHLPYPPV